MDTDLAFIAKPTQSMAGVRWYFDHNGNGVKLCRQRQVAEGVFSRLKTRYGVLVNSCQTGTRDTSDKLDGQGAGLERRLQSYAASLIGYFRIPWSVEGRMWRFDLDG